MTIQSREEVLRIMDEVSRSMGLHEPIYQKPAIYDPRKLLPAKERYRLSRVDKRVAIQKRKEATPCIDCGESYHHSQLDWDHRDPSKKKIQPRKLHTYSWETIERELKKCDVRCSNCHRIRTYKEKHFL